MLIFISYAHEDSHLVSEVSQRLSAAGLEVFQDTIDIPWGGIIRSEVQSALERAGGVVVVLSPASVLSQWVPYEVGYATALRKLILPLLTHPSIELPGYLAEYRYLSDLNQLESFIGRVKSIGHTSVSSNLGQLPEAVGAAKIIAEIQPQMLELLSEMREDLRSDETGLVREFVAMPNNRVVFSDPKLRFRYYDDAHPNLQLKVDKLLEMRLVTKEKERPFLICRMTPAFVAALLGGSGALESQHYSMR